MKEKMGDKVAKLNPNLIVLPEATQMKIEAGMVAAGEQMRSLARGIRTHMEDPWEVEDVWLIVAWHYAISKGRRRVFDGLAKWDKTCQVTEKGGVDAAFNSSFWNWLGGPMKVMGGVWVSLYLHDNLAKMFMMGRGIDFDVAMYALAVGAIAVMFTNRWLPIILERRAGVSEASLQLVITRLVTILIVIVTVVCAGTLLGVPAAGVLGLGGVGGLTFGLAAKDILSNLLGGTMLALLRPFTVGEEIYLLPQGGKFRGSTQPDVSDYFVKEIGWYQTELRAKDTKPTIVPNGYFLGANVINVTRYVARVVILEFRIRFQDRGAVADITSEMTAFLKEHRHVDDANYPVFAHLGGVQADHLTIEVQSHVYKMSVPRF